MRPQEEQCEGCSPVLYSERMSTSLIVTVRANDIVSLSWGLLNCDNWLTNHTP